MGEPELISLDVNLDKRLVRALSGQFLMIAAGANGFGYAGCRVSLKCCEGFALSCSEINSDIEVKQACRNSSAIIASQQLSYH